LFHQKHVLPWYEGNLPHPEQILFTPTSVNDITVYKQAWSTIENRTFFRDKINIEHKLNHLMILKQNSELYTPVKAVKGIPDTTKKRLKAEDDFFSTAVSRIRQPIESIFN
jgi:hypothetical protein